MRHVPDIPDAPLLNGGELSFDGFQLDLDSRALSLNGRPVHIRPREMDLLVYLAQRPNRFIAKAELIEGVWREPAVSDANLRVQMSALRRILAKGAGHERLIDGVPSRGYRFCPSVTPLPAPPAGPDRPRHRHNLPVRVKRFFGREHDCGRLVTLLSENRLATVVGPGGIGKTTLALTAAECLVDTFRDGVRFVDLAGLTDADLVAGTLAATIGLALGPDTAPDTLIAALAPQHILFVVDNCEHLVGPTAWLVESILTQTRHIHVLCTSREPLRADGECLLRLGPLELPPKDECLAPGIVATYPAIQLFNDRASQAGDDFRPDGAQIIRIADLCRRLDGNPLAIELAAARIGLFGLDGLITQLDENLGLLIQGRRTAVPRHKTLRETINWSYNLLPPDERRLLDRLAVFRGNFSLDAIRAVTGRDFSENDLLYSLAELVAKSLVNIESDSSSPLYRLLLLTREFALEKLAGSGDLDTIAQRHADYFLSLLMSTRRYGSPDAEPWMADIGAAINWGLGHPGNPELACKLIRASFNVMARFSYLPARRHLIERTLKRIGDAPETETVWKLAIHTQLLHNVQFTSADETTLMHWVAFTNDLAERICRRTGDAIANGERLATLCFSAFSRGNAPELLRHASEGAAFTTTTGEPDAWRVVFERSLFQAHHFSGHHDVAADVITRVLADLDETVQGRTLLVTDHISPAVTARIFRARGFWLQGRPVQATETAAEALELSLAYAPTITCYVLAFATIPIALWRGDHALAREAMQQMERAAAEQGLGYWICWARMYAFILETRSTGAAPDAPVTLPSTLIHNAHHADHLATLCLSDHPRALARVEAGLIGWNAPEVLRCRAEWALAMGVGVDAEAQLVQAIELARQQAAPGWELRAATSLARLRRTKGRTCEALNVLQAAIQGIDTGLSDRDIVAAQKLMSELELA